MTEEESITPFQVVKPLVSIEEAKNQWQAFEDLKTALLTKDDYQRIGDKQFIKRSGFRKIAVYFGLSDTIQEQEKIEREDGSFYWRIVVEVKAPNGRVNTGVGICDSNERDFAHLEHDVYSTAHTRAKSRAISDMVAGGVVSAEEMQTSSNYVIRDQPQYHESAENAFNLIMEKFPNAHEILEIETFDELITVKTKKYLDQQDWNEIHRLLRSLGYEWNGEARRWEVQT